MATGVELGIGYIETFAGNGKARSTGDGKLAGKAGIPLPHHVALDKEERYLYFAESGSDRVRRVDLQVQPDGSWRIAGCGVQPAPGKMT